MTFIGVLISGLLVVLVATGVYELTLFAILLPIIIGVSIDLLMWLAYFLFIVFMGNKFGDY